MDETARTGGSEDERERQFLRLEEFLEQTLDDETERDLFLLAGVEAINNAVEHGNEGDWNKIITSRLFGGRGWVAMAVTDEGPGFVPVLRNPASVTGSRGRGLGLIASNVDLLFFNNAGNQIAFIKGGTPVTAPPPEGFADIVQLRQAVFVTNLAGGREPEFYHVLGRALERCSVPGRRSVFLDLKNVRLLGSRDWSILFAEAESEDVDHIVLFNASPAIQAAGSQMGLATRDGVYGKILVTAEPESALAVLASILEGNEG